MANTDSGCFYSTEIASLLKSPIWEITHHLSFKSYVQPISKFCQCSKFDTSLSLLPKPSYRAFPGTHANPSLAILSSILCPLFNLFFTQQSECTDFQMEIIWVSTLLTLPWLLIWWRICLKYRRQGFSLWFGKIPWRRERLPTPVFWPGEFHGQRSLAGYCPWSHKESDTIRWLTLYCQLEENPCSFHDWCKHNIVAHLGACDKHWLVVD